MSKMSEISAEMDEKNIPTEQRNSLINRVSEGMHAAEKKIDAVKSYKPAQKATVSGPKTNLPAETVKLAEQIKLFATVTHNVVTLDGKNYVKAGVYQFIAAQEHILPSFSFDSESTQEEVWCTCILRNAGIEVSRATMYADKKELFLRDKPDFAVLGMAQTRAFVRAMKNIYGYLVELAGYQSIAVEEVEQGGNNNGKN